MSTAKITLYWYWTTNPQKIRLALEEWSLPYSLVTVDLARGAQHDSRYTMLNPRGKVPTLTVGEAVLWESGAALMYLAQNYPQIWPKEPADQGQALSLLFMESAIFQRLAGTHYWQQVIQPRLGKTPNLDKIAVAAQQLQPIYQILSLQLANQDYLFGEMSVVDCAFAPWLPHLNLSDWPSLSAWRSRLMARSSWQASELRQKLTAKL